MNMSLIALIFLPITFATQGWAGERKDYGRYVTPQELYAIYGDKSWKWEQGAGHFARGHRRFTAVLSVKDRSFGTGKWTLPGRGRLCFRALWRTKKGNGKSRTCFAHRTRNGAIYQKKQPNGDWYLFKSKVVAEGDEFNKVVEENLVNRGLMKIRGG